MNDRGIVATEADVGRRVKMLTAPHLTGELLSYQGCGRCGEPCCWVQYDGDKKPIATHQAKLAWADGELI